MSDVARDRSGEGSPPERTSFVLVASARALGDKNGCGRSDARLLAAAAHDALTRTEERRCGGGRDHPEERVSKPMVEHIVDVSVDSVDVAIPQVVEVVEAQIPKAWSTSLRACTLRLWLTLCMYVSVAQQVFSASSCPFDRGSSCCFLRIFALSAECLELYYLLRPKTVKVATSKFEVLSCGVFCSFLFVGRRSERSRCLQSR